MTSSPSPGRTRRFAIFDTTNGRCGVAWGERGIVGVELPGPREAETRERLLRQCPGAQEALPPPSVQRTIDGIVALLCGETAVLETADLDMSGVAPFDRRVYETVRAIPPGTTLSYGQVAVRLGGSNLARDVGQALGRNPFPLVVPCHRVVAADGSLGGFSAYGGVTTKRRLLSIERAPVSDDLFTPG